MNHKTQKAHNIFEVFQLIRSCPTISATEIAQKTKLQNSTVSNLLKEMKIHEMISQVGKGLSGVTGGKRSDLLQLNGNYGFIGGIYIKNDEILFYVVDFECKLIAKNAQSTQSLSDAQLQKLIGREIIQLINQYSPYLGTGIAVCSVVDHEGNILPSNQFDRKLPILINQSKNDLSGAPLFMENDANCSALLIQLRDLPLKKSLMHFLVFEEPFAVGLGIIINGELWRGTSGAAGEIPNTFNLFINDKNNDLLVKKGPDISYQCKLIVQHMAFLAEILDIHDIFVSGEFSLKFEKILKKECLFLEQKTPGYKVNISANVDMPVMGACFLVQQMHVKNIFGNS